MLRYTFFLLYLLATTTAKAQNTSNALHGYYKAQDESQLYTYFAFDGNGKVDIMGMGDGDFFTDGDTLIIFPDKSLFKFRIEKDRLTGISDWVKNGVWIRQDTIVINKRTDESLAKNRAMLLNEYYRKTRTGIKETDLLFDEDLLHRYEKTLEDLCGNGLPRACMELFGLRLMNDIGGIGAVLNNKTAIPLKNNPELIALAQKIINMGEPEGHTLLAKYWYASGEKEKAAAEFEAAITAGSKTAALVQLGLELEEAAAAGEQPDQATEPEK